jgi:hypothetical protein
MQIDLTINKGRGYVTADENRAFCTDVNVIPIDSIYTPIRNVKYAVEPYRVEMKTDYDKLVLEIWTDGTITPENALAEAAKIAKDHFSIFVNFNENEIGKDDDFDEEDERVRQLLNTPVEELGYYLDQLDLVLVMSVEPGFGGQKFMPSALDKLRWLKAEKDRRGLKFLLEVDGGVDAATAPQCVAAGADVLVAGSAIFGAADPAAAVRAMAAL